MRVRRVERSLRKRRLALFALFGLPGLAISSWVARTPAIRDLIHATTEQMGLVLLGLSAGSMLGIVASNALITRFGARDVTAGGMAGIVTSMPVVGVGAELGLAGLVAVGLFLFGVGMGLTDIAVNVEGSAIERAAGVPVLPSMHGCFSVGTVVGALAGVFCNLIGVPVGGHLALIGLAGVPILASQLRHLAPDTGRAARGVGREASSAPTRGVWRDRRLILIGVIVLVMALGEGAAVDWLPLVMVDGHGVSALTGSVVFAAFAASMAVGRFCGGRLLNRFGRVRVLRSSAMAAVVGIGCIALVDNPLVAAAAVLLWGLGVSLGFPMAMSAAGDSGANPAGRAALVATMGYVAFLVGPPALGVIGEDYGLRQAMLVPLALVLLAVVLAPALAPRDPARRATPAIRTKPSP